MGRTRIAVLLSGGGSNFQSILDAVGRGEVAGEVALVISSNPDAYGLVRAKKAGIPAETVVPRGRKRSEFEEDILRLLRKHDIHLVCLAGWMLILSPDFVKRAPPMMNIHPALLPRHGGKGMYGHHVHEAVLRSGDAVSGPTVHFVTPEVDAGPIILQKEVPVLKDDTPETLARRVLEQEHVIYPEAVRLFCAGKLGMDGNRVEISD